MLSNLDIAHALPMAQTAEEITSGTNRRDHLGRRPGPGVRRAAVSTEGTRVHGPLADRRSRRLSNSIGSSSSAPQRSTEWWTELPGDLDPRIGQIAERWTAGATSDYRKVLAIQQHFHRPGFVYSTDVDISIDADGLLEFLTQTRTGFCQHYTAAMAVMVRALGLPARIAVGYRSGTQQEDGTLLGPER